MSRETLEEHRRVWAMKPVLEEVYRVWFDELLAGAPPGGLLLEIGAGPGFLGAYARSHRPRVRLVTSDFLSTPWNDLVADAQELPVATASLDGLCGLDVLHHLGRPARFFAEAGRALKDGARLTVVEPWVTPLSFPIYRWLHQEGCRPGLDPWDPFGARGGRTKQALDGDAAVVWKLVRSTPAGRWNALGFDAPEVRVLNAFGYLLSLGFKRGSLLPGWAAPTLLRVDRALQAAAPVLGLRALVVWRRRGR